jgi:hypothetical protein
MIKTELVETKCISRPKGTYTEFNELQWVANKPLPAVGSEVTVKINGIGRSKVLRYYVEHGFIGLVVQPVNPPDWYRMQNESKTDSALYDWDACYVFPAECLEFQVRDDDGKVDEVFYKEALQPC